jgi:hypothetical protein
MRNKGIFPVNPSVFIVNPPTPESGFLLDYTGAFVLNYTGGFIVTNEGIALNKEENKNG